MRIRCMWSLTRLVTIGVLLCAIMQAAPTRASAQPDPYVPDELVAKLNPLLNAQIIAATFGLTVIDQIDSLPIYRFKIRDGVSPLVKAGQLQQGLLDSLLYAEPNYIGQAPESRQQSSWAAGGDSGAYQAQWAQGVIRLPEAHGVTRGAGITVAVLDTGVDRAHPALAGHLTTGFDFVDLDADPSEEGVYGRDRAYGHGTHVAGLVALSAPEARIMPLRILRPDGSGTSWMLAEALRFAANGGAKVINVSYTFKTTTPSGLVADMLEQVTCAQSGMNVCRLSALPGAVVVAAAGNSGPSTSPEYPAADGNPGVLAVAASDEADQLAAFSTRGTWVDIAGPGVNILSSVPGGGYGVWSGTSMAAPLVAGSAALVRAAGPSLRPADVAGRITTTGDIIAGPVARRVDSAAALGLP